MSDLEPLDPDEHDDLVEFWESEQPEPTVPAQPIEFPSSPIRENTDKPKKRRRKKTDQLDMFGQ